MAYEDDILDPFVNEEDATEEDEEKDEEKDEGEELAE